MRQPSAADRPAVVASRRDRLHNTRRHIRLAAVVAGRGPRVCLYPSDTAQAALTRSQQLTTTDRSQYSPIRPWQHIVDDSCSRVAPSAQAHTMCSITFLLVLHCAQCTHLGFLYLRPG